MFKMSLFHFPSTVVFVDDSSLFLDSIKLSDEFNLKKIKTFTNPLEALKFFQNYQPILAETNFLSLCNEYEKSDLVGHLPTNIDFAKLSNIFANRQIEDDVSVLIVDYDMPEMKGIELCEKLKHLPCKKILLTGALAEKEVISAFNEGIIDCFIRKNSENLMGEINIYIKLLMEKYYTEKSAALLSHLETGKKLHFSDAAFASFFSEWCQTNQITKYFIIDKFGNLRVEDKTGKAYNFVVYNDQTVNEFIALNLLVDEENEFLQSISTKQRLPFFGEQVNGWDIESNEWENHLHPCNVVNGANKY